MASSSDPQIYHQMIPIPGRAPVALLGLEVPTPEPVQVVLTIDMSESCGDLSKLYAFVQKLLGQLPSSWPLQVFRLSDSSPISRSNLSLHDLNESTCWVSELCVGQDLHRTASRKGRFLRPVVESIESNLSSTPILLIVLTDGPLADFGNVSSSTEIDMIGILPSLNRFARHDLKVERDPLMFFSMQDARLDEAIRRYSHPFYGAVVVEATGSAADPERLFRVDAAGKLTAWSRMPNHIIDLSKDRQFILFDGSLDDLQAIHWRIHSCATESTKTLRGSLPTTISNRTLEKRLVEQFNNANKRQDNDLIAWLNHEDPRFPVVVERLEFAISQCDQGEAWIDDDGSMRVFADVDGLGIVSDEGHSNHEAILVIGVVCPESRQHRHIGFFSLARDKKPAVRFDAEITRQGLSATDVIAIHFDDQLYRWMLETTSVRMRTQAQALELGYYTAERIDVPFCHSEGEVVALFSGHIGR